MCSKTLRMTPVSVRMIAWMVVLAICNVCAVPVQTGSVVHDPSEGFDVQVYQSGDSASGFLYVNLYFKPNDTSITWATVNYRIDSGNTLSYPMRNFQFNNIRVPLSSTLSMSFNYGTNTGVQKTSKWLVFQNNTPPSSSSGSMTMSSSTGMPPSSSSGPMHLSTLSPPTGSNPPLSLSSLPALPLTVSTASPPPTLPGNPLLSATAPLLGLSGAPAVPFLSSTGANAGGGPVISLPAGVPSLPQLPSVAALSSSSSAPAISLPNLSNGPLPQLPTGNVNLTSPLPSVGSVPSPSAGGGFSLPILPTTSPAALLASILSPSPAVTTLATGSSSTGAAGTALLPPLQPQPSSPPPTTSTSFGDLLASLLPGLTGSSNNNNNNQLPPTPTTPPSTLLTNLLPSSSAGVGGLPPAFSLPVLSATGSTAAAAPNLPALSLPSFSSSTGIAAPTLPAFPLLPSSSSTGGSSQQLPPPLTPTSALLTPPSSPTASPFVFPTITIPPLNSGNNVPPLPSTPLPSPMSSSSSSSSGMAGPFGSVMSIGSDGSSSSSNSNDAVANTLALPLLGGTVVGGPGSPMPSGALNMDPNSPLNALNPSNPAAGNPAAATSPLSSPLNANPLMAPGSSNNPLGSSVPLNSNSNPLNASPLNSIPLNSSPTTNPNPLNPLSMASPLTGASPFFPPLTTTSPTTSLTNLPPTAMNTNPAATTMPSPMSLSQPFSNNMMMLSPLPASSPQLLGGVLSTTSGANTAPSASTNSPVSASSLLPTSSSLLQLPTISIVNDSIVPISLPSFTLGSTGTLNLPLPSPLTTTTTTSTGTTSTTPALPTVGGSLPVLPPSLAGSTAAAAVSAGTPPLPSVSDLLSALLPISSSGSAGPLGGGGGLPSSLLPTASTSPSNNNDELESNMMIVAANNFRWGISRMNDNGYLYTIYFLPSTVLVQSRLDFVDVHYTTTTSSAGPPQVANYRMVQTVSGRQYVSPVRMRVASSSSLVFSFTYSINGTATNTQTYTFTPTATGASASTVSSSSSSTGASAAGGPFSSLPSLPITLPTTTTPSGSVLDLSNLGNLAGSTPPPFNLTGGAGAFPGFPALNSNNNNGTNGFPLPTASSTPAASLPLTLPSTILPPFSPILTSAGALSLPGNDFTVTLPTGWRPSTAPLTSTDDINNLFSGMLSDGTIGYGILPTNVGAATLTGTAPLYTVYVKLPSATGRTLANVDYVDLHLILTGSSTDGSANSATSQQVNYRMSPIAVPDYHRDVLLFEYAGLPLKPGTTVVYSFTYSIDQVPVDSAFYDFVAPIALASTTSSSSTAGALPHP